MSHSLDAAVLESARMPVQSDFAAARRRLCAIVVTYADRHLMFAQIVERLADLGVGTVVAVFNGNYRPYALTGSTRLVVVNNADNHGSAGGFCDGIEAAMQVDADHYLLLDDDNLPEPDCIDRLFAAHAGLGGDPMQALLAFRPGQPWQRIAAGSGGITIAKPNTYGWFNMANIWHRLQHLLGLFGTRRKARLDSRDSFVPIGCAPYGGLFLSRQALMLSELPDRRYFCYYDDLDYTGRLAQRGVSYKIYTGARIRDLEYSWYLSNGRVHPLFSPHTSDTRVFFDLRNAFIFYRSRIRSRVCYLVNGIGFWLFVTFLAVFRSADLNTTRRRLATIRRAVRFGSRGEFASYCENP